MTSDEYASLMDFLAARFARMDERMGALEERLTRSEVLWESMRDDLRRMAEGVVAVNERLDRFQAEVNARFAEMNARMDEMNARMDDLDRRTGRIEVRFDRFAVDFGTVRLDHGARIEALERWRSGRDTEG
jgi:hypothetical protein